MRKPAISASVECSARIASLWSAMEGRVEKRSLVTENCIKFRIVIQSLKQSQHLTRCMINTIDSNCISGIYHIHHIRMGQISNSTGNTGELFRSRFDIKLSRHAWNVLCWQRKNQWPNGQPDICFVFENDFLAKTISHYNILQRVIRHPLYCQSVLDG